MFPEDAVALAQDLIVIRSDPPNAFEGGVFDYLKEGFEQAGFPTIEQETSLGPGRSNLLVLSKEPGGEDSHDGLMFAGHMDVVPPGDEATWLKDPFEPWIDGLGQLHGRGSTDMKGGIAAYIAAFLACGERLAQPESKLVGLLFTVSEELTLTGAKAFAASPEVELFSTAVVPEPSGLVLVRGHKGVIFAKFTTHGKAAHGSVPEKGVNAIKIAIDLYGGLESRFLADQALYDHPVLGKPSMNLGFLNGGQAANVVPDACTIGIDRRLTWGESVEEIRKSYRQTIDGTCIPKGGKIEFELINAEEPYLLEDDDPFLQRITADLGPASVMNGYTEAGIYFNKANISTIIFGPGSINQAHVANEFIAIEDIKKAEGIYVKLILDHVKKS
jgi:acetylornithine deacetylase/succinyl-diaminopimelate desuccinylase-like protein